MKQVRRFSTKFVYDLFETFPHNKWKLSLGLRARWLSFDVSGLQNPIIFLKISQIAATLENIFFISKSSALFLIVQEYTLHSGTAV